MKAFSLKHRCLRPPPSFPPSAARSPVIPLSSWPGSSARRSMFTTPPRFWSASTTCEAFDSIRYAQKAKLEPWHPRPGAPARRAWSTPSAPARSLAGPGGRLCAAGDPPPIVYTADIFDRESLDPGRREGIHVNCGSPDMIDQLGQRRAGPRDHAAHQSRLRPRPQPENQHRRRAIEARHLARTTRRLPAPRRSSRPGRDGPAPAHRLGHRPGASLAGLRGDGEAGPGSRPLAHVDQRRRRTAGALSGRATLTSTWTSTSSCGTPRASGWKTRFGHRLHLEIEPGRYLVAESGFLVSEIRAIKQMGGNTFYLVDAGFNNLARPILYGAYHPMSIVPRKSRDGAATSAGRRRGGRAAVRIGRHLHADRRRLCLPRGSLPAGRGRRPGW